MIRRLIKMHPFRMLTRVPALILILAPLLEGAGEEPDWPSISSYRTGDTALEEIIAPIDLEVVDPKSTAKARHAAIAQLPPVYRSLDSDDDPTVTAVVTSFESTRDRFVAEISQTFAGHPIERLGLYTSLVLSSLIAVTLGFGELFRVRALENLVAIFHDSPETWQLLIRLTGPLSHAEALAWLCAVMIPLLTDGAVRGIGQEPAFIDSAVSSQ